ncbi:MAG: HAD family hydrolase [Nitrososphaerales archaeon]
MRIDGIIFDMDGTLNRSQKYYDAYQVTYPRVLSVILNKSEKEVLSLLSEGKKIIRHGFTKLIQHLGVNSSLFFAKMAEAMPLNELIDRDEKLQTMMNDLKTANLSLALHSNTGRSLVKGIINALGIDEGFFDVIVTSDESGLKPDPEPYLYTLEKLRLAPNRSIYVGDRVEMEIKTAKHLGMTTILLTSGIIESKEEGQDLASYRIDNLYTIPALVSSIRD